MLTILDLSSTRGNPIPIVFPVGIAHIDAVTFSTLGDDFILFLIAV